MIVMMAICTHREFLIRLNRSAAAERGAGRRGEPSGDCAAPSAALHSERPGLKSEQGATMMSMVSPG
jgi:hypothetical protein